jgi:hypothetical protein
MRGNKMMTNKQFISAIGKSAQNAYATSKILPSLTIAQAILESGWGKSGLTIKANNLFGMKCGTKWTGAKFNVKTAEQKPDGTPFYIMADFRKYKTLQACIDDHGEFLSTDRYKAVRGTVNYKEACKFIKEAGYATDVKYPQKLIDLIELYNLDDYDSVATALAKPIKTITKDSSINDIKWLQTKLNKCLAKTKNFKALTVDGLHGKNTLNAVLDYWILLKWNAKGKDDGSRVGAKTISALNKNRIK